MDEGVKKASDLQLTSGLQIIGMIVGLVLWLFIIAVFSNNISKFFSNIYSNIYYYNSIYHYHSFTDYPLGQWVTVMLISLFVLAPKYLIGVYEGVYDFSPRKIYSRNNYLIELLLFSSAYLIWLLIDVAALLLDWELSVSMNLIIMLALALIAWLLVIYYKWKYYDSKTRKWTAAAFLGFLIIAGLVAFFMYNYSPAPL